MKKCENCAFAVWDYGEVIECCNSGPCPSEEDFEAAEENGYLAINDIAEDIYNEIRESLHK